MKAIPFATAIAAAGLLAAASSAIAAPVPCEDKLAELRSSVASATLSDADAKSVKALEAKGVERCNADDDKRANGFFDEALKLVKH